MKLLVCLGSCYAFANHCNFHGWELYSDHTTGSPSLQEYNLTQLGTHYFYPEFIIQALGSIFSSFTCGNGLCLKKILARISEEIYSEHL